LNSGSEHNFDQCLSVKKRPDVLCCLRAGRALSVFYLAKIVLKIMRQNVL